MKDVDDQRRIYVIDHKGEGVFRDMSHGPHSNQRAEVVQATKTGAYQAGIGIKSDLTNLVKNS